MSPTSTEVIVERIEGMKTLFNDKIDNLSDNFDEFKKCFNKKVLPEINDNTEFRQKAKGIIGAISFVSVAFGGFIMWLFDKIRFWERGT